MLYRQLSGLGVLTILGLTSVSCVEGDGNPLLLCPLGVLCSLVKLPGLPFFLRLPAQGLHSRLLGVRLSEHICVCDDCELVDCVELICCEPVSLLMMSASCFMISIPISFPLGVPSRMTFCLKIRSSMNLVALIIGAYLCPERITGQ